MIITSKRNDLLKLIAMVTMLIDHIGVLLLPQYPMLRVIGRIAFPIFAYQLALGYEKTSDKKQYFLRILIFGIISQGPYMFLNEQFQVEWLRFNVILLFAFSIGVLKVYEWFNESLYCNKCLSSMSIGLLLVCLVFMPTVLEVTFEGFMLSYGSYGIGMILVFSRFKQNIPKMVIAYVMLEFVNTYYTNAYYLDRYSQQWIGEDITLIQSLMDAKTNLHWMGNLLVQGYYVQIWSIFGLLTILSFQSAEMKFTLNKYISYLFYPAHMLILIVIRLFLL